MNKRPNDLPIKQLLTTSAIAGAAMSAVVLILFFSNNLLSVWTITTDMMLWGCIVWEIIKLRKASGGEMRFGRAFTHGLQISFYSSLFVAVTYYIILRFLAPSFLEQYFNWTQHFLNAMIPNNLPADQLADLKNQIQSEVALTRANTTIMSYTLGKVVNFSLFGGLFSLVAAAILRHRNVAPTVQPEHNEPEN